MYMYMYHIHLYIHLFIHPCIHPSICGKMYLSMHPPIYLWQDSSIHASTHLSVANTCPSIHHPFIYLYISIYMYMYLRIYMSIYRFVEPPVLNMAAVVEDSTCRTPLIFVLSPGVVCSHVSD